MKLSYINLYCFFYCDHNLRRFNKDWLYEKYKDETNVSTLDDEEKKVLRGIYKRDRSLANKPSATDLKFLNDCYKRSKFLLAILSFHVDYCNQLIVYICVYTCML